MFEQHAECRLERLAVQAFGVEGDERLGPVQGFGDAGQLAEVDLTEALHELDGLAGNLRRQVRHFETDDVQLLLLRGVADEEIEAAPFECFAQFAGVVAGENDDGPVFGGERAELGDADLEIAQHLEQECFELGVGAVDFVDEEHDGLVAEDGSQEGPLQEEAHREEDVLFVGEAVGGFGEGVGAGESLLQLIAEQLRVQELLGILPLIESFGLVQSFVALEADEVTAERAGDGFGQFSFADAGGSFGEQGFAQLLRQVDGCGDFVAGDVLLFAKAVVGLFDGLVSARCVHVRGRLLWLLASGTRPLRYVVVYLTGKRFARHRNSWGGVQLGDRIHFANGELL